MKRKYFFIIIALLVMSYYTSDKPTEIADRIMVHAIGIDVEDSSDTPEYKVTMQVFSPSEGSNDAASDPSMPNVSIVKGRGRDISAAVQDCTAKLGGTVFIGQNRIILFGHDVDFSNKKELFGYFLSSSEAFLNTECAAAEKTAEELLEMPIGNSAISSEQFPQLIQAAKMRGAAIGCSFMELLDSMEKESQSTVLPIITKTSEPSTESDSEKNKLTSDSGLKIEQGALYMNGKFKDTLSADEMGILSMLRGEGKNVRTDIIYDGMEIVKTFRLKSREVTPEPSEKDIVFKISCSASPKDDQMFASSKDRNESNRMAEEKICSEAQELADKLTEKYSDELIGGDKFMRRYYPSIYRSNEKRNIKFVVDFE